MTYLSKFLGLLVLLAFAAHSADSTNDISVDFCRLLTTPERFTGKVVSVRAHVVKYRHGIILHSKDCNGGMFLELGAKLDVAPKREVALMKDSEYEKFDKALFIFKDGTTQLRNQIEATFEGRFDSIYGIKNEKRVRVSPGYGQNSLFASRLVLYKVSDVTVSEKKD